MAWQSAFKISSILPLLKKKGLDKDILANYRPMSNLTFLSKIVERAVFQQVLQHLKENSLLDEKQLAYRNQHSTETALIYVLNSAFMACDNG
jgi:hypothetical protein